MNTIIEITKELVQLGIILTVLGFVTKLFLAHTLLGKIITITIKNIYLTIRGLLRIIKFVLKKAYGVGKTTNKLLSKKKPVKQISVSKKVVNGDNSNVIDFKSAEQLRHKWHQ